MSDFDEFSKKDFTISGALILELVAALGELPYHRVAPLLDEVSTLDENVIWTDQRSIN